MKISVSFEPFIVATIGYHIEYDYWGITIYGPRHKERTLNGLIRWQACIWFALGRPHGYVGRTWLFPPKLEWLPYRRPARVNA